MTRPARGERITSEDALRRWPCLSRACQWVAVLSAGEAGCALRDYWHGAEESGEAVDHFGGTVAVIRCAWRARHRLPPEARRPIRW